MQDKRFQPGMLVKRKLDGLKGTLLNREGGSVVTVKWEDGHTSMVQDLVLVRIDSLGSLVPLSPEQRVDEVLHNLKEVAARIKRVELARVSETTSEDNTKQWYLYSERLELAKATLSLIEGDGYISDYDKLFDILDKYASTFKRSFGGVLALFRTIHYGGWAKRYVKDTEKVQAELGIKAYRNKKVESFLQKLAKELRG